MMTELTEDELVRARSDRPGARTLVVASDLGLRAKRILAPPSVGMVAAGEEFPTSVIPAGALIIDPDLAPGTWFLR